MLCQHPHAEFQILEECVRHGSSSLDFSLSSFPSLRRPL
jgi:hypothetical protein